MSSASGLAKLTWVELKLLLREPLTVALAVVFPVIVLFVMGETFGRQANPAFRGADALDYYTPAYFGMAILALTFFSIPAHLASYRERGVLRRLRAFGVPAWKVAASQLAVAFVLAVVAAAVLAAFVAAFYGLARPGSVPGVAAAFVLGTAAMAAVGLLLGSVLPGQRAAQGTGLILFFAMMLLSGAGPPTGAMSSTMRTVGEALPLTHVIRALQDAWLTGTASPLELLVLAAIAAAGSTLAALAFRWE